MTISSLSVYPPYSCFHGQNAKHLVLMKGTCPQGLSVLPNNGIEGIEGRRENAV